jgi:hypothetical protein
MKSNRPAILADHRRRGKTLVPPFTHLLGPLKEVSWRNTMIPEFIWIALLHEAHGDGRAVEVITEFCRLARLASSSSARTWFAPVSHFGHLSENEMRKLKAELQKRELLAALASPLKVLAAWYPEFPLASLVSAPRDARPRAPLEALKQLVNRMFDRSGREPMMTQATAIWLAFDAEILEVSPDVSLAHFPEIEGYPRTEMSKRIGGSIRSGLNSFFGSETHYSASYTWPRDFWNRGLAIDECTFSA